MIRKMSVLTAMIILTCSCVACQQQSPKVYQVSTIAALIAGDFDGDATVGQLLDNGDFGLGTFNALDGEMIVLDGVVYQAKADGTVRVATRDQLVPFAAAVNWSNAAPTERFEVYQTSSLSQLMEHLDLGITGKADVLCKHPRISCCSKDIFHGSTIQWMNYFVAARIDGKFDYIKFRSPPVQKSNDGYPTLAEALKSQAVFEKKEISGTLVAMRCPSWVGGANVPGWHMHFISDDRKYAGHVLDVKFSDAKATMLPIREFQVVLPDTESYRKVGQSASGVTSRPAGE